jgi:hypothetical protein
LAMSKPCCLVLPYRKRTWGLKFLHLKTKICPTLSRCRFEPSSSNFKNSWFRWWQIFFFKFNNLWVQFHVHVTHSSRLRIIEMKFQTSSNWKLWYRVLQQVKI